MPELPLVGDEFAGYRLRAVLGKGGMSTVYQAENPRLGNVIALKVLAPELASDDVFRTRFLEESRIAAAMNHPHVIPIHDMGSGDGLLYIAMRCVSGTDLRQMISKRGRLLPDTAVFLLSQAARALDAAHRRGLVHRDVKPGNLLVERGIDESGADPDHLYLADFGITKPAIGRSGLTSSGQFLGTIDYVAPEQIRGLSVLGMADQYSLGCVLYECLTGRVPFEKDLDAAIIWAHVEETPTRATLLRPDLPAPIDEVFDQVLAKQPGDRYANCRDFMTAARSALRVPETAATPRPSTDVSLRAPRSAPPPADHQELAHDRGTSARGLITTSARRGGPPALPPALPLLSAPPDTGAAPLYDAPPPVDEAAFHHGTGYPDRHAYPGGADDDGHGADDPRGWSPPRRPRRNRGAGRLPLLLLAVAFVATVAVGLTLGAWLGLPGAADSGHQPGASSSATVAATASTPTTNAALTPPSLPATPQKTLKQALALVNATVWTTGYLPPKSCTFLSAVSARCSEPYPGITMAFFQNYSSPGALYTAYEAAIKQANNGRFVVNVQDCGASAPPANGAEIAWNHFGEHSQAYSIQQLETGKLNAASQAAGRMFCNYDSSTNTEDIIWTETDGNMLGEVTGSPHLAVWNWWLHVHHNIAFNGQPMGAMDMAPSAFPKA
jgi:serine/threonine protein kinase